MDLLAIGVDVLPLKERDPKKPNSNISLKGAIAHEIIGHRDAALCGFALTGVVDEVQASIRAARFAPELSREERSDLVRDAIERLRSRGMNLRDVKGSLHINER